MLKQYRLAASARTDDRGNLALRTAEIDAIEDLLYAKAAAQIPHDDRAMGIGCLFACGQWLKATRQFNPDSRIYKCAIDSRHERHKDARAYSVPRASDARHAGCQGVS